MSTFKHILEDGFEAHARALPAGGGLPGERSRSMLRSIHRRRRTRAAATAGGSVLAVGAVAVGAMNLRPAGEAGPQNFPTPPPGAPGWCDLNSYPQVNPDALGASPYDGRVYADYVQGVFVYVARDGSHQTLKPDADGDVAAVLSDGATTFSVPFEIPNLTYVAWDIDSGSGAGGDFIDGVRDPHLLYEWTTTVPETIPVGVDAADLSQVLVSSLGFSGSGFRPSSVPKGAVVETVFRWTDGHERTVKVIPDSFGGLLRDYAGIASVSVRVSDLPDGATFEITSTYDPSKTWAAACTTGVPTPTPTSAAPVATPYLEGPEAAVFQCLAPLPAAAEDAVPTTIDVRSGVTWVSGIDVTADFGPRGIVVTSRGEIYEISPDLIEPTAPGWRPDFGSTEPDGPLRGALFFATLVWVDPDGVIVGRQVSVPDPDGLLDIGGMMGTIGGAASGQHQFSYLLGYVDSLGVPCGGVDPGTLASASLVWIEGYGPDPDHMTWSWTRVPPPS